MFATMTQATESYWEKLHEYSRVAYDQQHATQRERSPNLTEIQSTLTKFQNYHMAKRETCQAIECEEQVKEKEISILLGNPEAEGVNEADKETHTPRELLIDKDSIFRTSRKKILEENENPGELLYCIKLPLPYSSKWKSE
jgi:hypothetical protein